MTATVKFIHMADGDAEDYHLAAAAFAASRCATGHVDALFDQLKTLLGDPVGYRIDRYQHSLQTATRALRDGRPDAYVVAALFHDIGDTLAPHNHGDIAAGILKPYVPADIHWVIANHAIFQGYYFWHLDGSHRDRDARERFRGHPWFETAVEFCDRYDQRSFDPAYETLPLHEFDPIVRRVFATPTQWAG